MMVVAVRSWFLCYVLSMMMDGWMDGGSVEFGFLNWYNECVEVCRRDFPPGYRMNRARARSTIIN